MKYILFFFINILFATSVFSANISGEIVYKNGKICLKESRTQKIYKILPQTSEVHESLKKLKSGDMVRGQGQLVLLQQALKLNSINSVGLKKILGQWISQDQFRYDFKDYETLSLSAPILSNENQWSYRVTPDTSENWSILFLNQNSVKVGKLIFPIQENSQELLKIVLFDTKNGQISQEIDLKRTTP